MLSGLQKGIVHSETRSRWDLDWWGHLHFEGIGDSDGWAPWNLQGFMWGASQPLSAVHLTVSIWSVFIARENYTSGTFEPAHLQRLSRTQGSNLVVVALAVCFSRQWVETAATVDYQRKNFALGSMANFDVRQSGQFTGHQITRRWICGGKVANGRESIVRGMIRNGMSPQVRCKCSIRVFTRS